MRFLAVTILLVLSWSLVVSPTAQIPRLAPRGDRGVHHLDTPPFSPAQTGTTYYGGTFWAADSARWEALENSCWTFDSGVGSDLVGSSANPHVDPFKQPGLHATLEGWTGVDLTRTQIPYFRRLADDDPRWGESICVGGSAGLGGNASFWAGVLQSEAEELCFSSGQGYGNSWSVCIGKEFDSGTFSSTLDYDFRSDTEAGFDFTEVLIDTSGGTAPDVLLAVHDGSQSGHAHHPLVPGQELPTEPGPVRVKFCFRSDAWRSDEDGLHPTNCGAFAVDDIVLSGAINDVADFEDGDDGWTLLSAEPGRGGEWTNIVALSDLPASMTACGCALTDSVLVFEDLTTGGHGVFQDNLAVSPWIDLGPDGYANPAPGKFVQADVYAELPFLNYVFVKVMVQVYPKVCLETGAVTTSSWMSDGFYYYFGGVPRCTDPADPGSVTRFDIGPWVPRGAEQLRIGLGVVSYCRFTPTCTGITNSTPWFDNVKLGVYGDPNLPLIGVRTIDLPQDSFPQNGTTNVAAPSRLDCNNTGRFNGPEEGSALGDTLVVFGGTGGAEVRVQFAVWPASAINPPAFDSWLTSHTFEGSARGQDWYSARLDTAEVGGAGAIDGIWMTAYHEDDPNFQGLDTDTDPLDLDPFDPYDQGPLTRLLNDIFPDDLFVGGTRVNLFYKARFIGRSDWITLPDTTGGRYYEWESLPAIAQDSTQSILLHVDHADGFGVQPVVEEALLQISGDPGGHNFEGVPWDRFDVRAPSSHQGSLGRPLWSEFGADWDQIICYNVIIWNSGLLPSFNLVKEDGDVLTPWMSLAEFENRNFYGSGDGLVNSAFGEAASEPSARRFIEDYCGVTLSCNTYRDLDCPSGKAQDLTQCVNVDPVSGARVAASLGRLVDHLAQGNGCPRQESYDVLGVNSSPRFGVASGDEEYRSAAVPGPTQYASVINDANLTGSLTYRSVIDGVSVHQRRDDQSGDGNCAAEDPRTAVTERMDEVLTFLGLGFWGIPYCCYCSGTGIPDPDPTPSTTLLNAAPNPIRPGQVARLSFTLSHEGSARLEIFDLQGRLVRILFDGKAPEGETEVFWDGTTSAGKRVAGGVYFYRLSTVARTSVKKLVVLSGGS